MSDWATTGTMVREIRFQLSLSAIGITGWMLSVNFWPSRAGPIPPSKFA